MASNSGVILSHWYCLLEGMQYSTQDFYSSLEEVINSRNLPEIKISRINLHEGGALSAKREYLNVKRKTKNFDVCAAPYGNGFFVSWWLREAEGCLSAIPLLGTLMTSMQSMTYYQIDTTLMFQESIRKSVLQVIDEITKAKGIRELSEEERKPIMHSMFKK